MKAETEEGAREEERKSNQIKSYVPTAAFWTFNSVLFRQSVDPNICQCVKIERWPNDWYEPPSFLTASQEKPFGREISMISITLLGVLTTGRGKSSNSLSEQETPAAKRPPPLGHDTWAPSCRQCARVISVPEHFTPLMTTSLALTSPCQYQVS